MKKGASVVIVLLITIIVILIIFIGLLLTGVVDINIDNDKINNSSSNNEISNNNGDNNIDSNNNNKNTISDDVKYSSIIDEYKRAMNDSNYFNNMEKYTNINTIVVANYFNYLKGNFSGTMTINYLYYDINKDGNNELVVFSNSDSRNNNIAEIYTYDGNKANMFIKEGCLGERCIAHIYDNGIIYFYGAGGAAIHGLDFYKIGNDGYSKDIVKTFGVEIKDGIHSIESDGVKTNFKSDEEAINSVVNGASVVDLSKLQFKEIK